MAVDLLMTCACSTQETKIIQNIKCKFDSDAKTIANAVFPHIKDHNHTTCERYEGKAPVSIVFVITQSGKTSHVHLQEKNAFRRLFASVVCRSKEQNLRCFINYV